MLDIKFVRDNTELVQQALINRGTNLDLNEFLELEKKRRAVLAEVEALKSKRNTVSQQISVMKKNKENADDLIVEMRSVGVMILQSLMLKLKKLKLR